MVTWELLLDIPSEPEPAKRYGNRGIPSAQCNCGRFAKLRRAYWYYNGNCSVLAHDVLCASCGEQTVRLT